MKLTIHQNISSQLLFWTLILSFFSGAAMAIEEPKYELMEKSGPLELRHYLPLIVAEVEVSGNLNEASSKGFRLIADYIFGNNHALTGPAQKIAMTAPVTIEPIDNKIRMSPILSFEPSSERWQVRFVMPRNYTIATLPIPNNTQVKLREVSGRKVAVLIFSGMAGEVKTKEKTKELLSWMASKQLKPVSTPELARYNPPWTLPFMRRNEVIVEYK